MADSKLAEIQADSDEPYVAQAIDMDPAETEEWLESLEFVINSKGHERAKYLLAILEQRAKLSGVDLPMAANTPYINTIPRDKQPAYPGNREIERRVKSIIRWNAMAMVVRANKNFEGLGGHISSFASSATLYDVAFNHFFRGRGESGYDGDHIYFQGHTSPGMYSRAFLEGRLSEANLDNFRRELQDEAGLSSYPHPWLMPRVLGIPNGVDGAGSDHGHLSSSVQRIPA